jgi:hypothetical protein
MPNLHHVLKLKSPKILFFELCKAHVVSQRLHKNQDKSGRRVWLYNTGYKLLAHQAQKHPSTSLGFISVKKNIVNLASMSDHEIPTL